jgi:hypothetical protein
MDEISYLTKPCQMHRPLASNEGLSEDDGIRRASEFLGGTSRGIFQRTHLSPGLSEKNHENYPRFAPSIFQIRVGNFTAEGNL